MEHNFFIQARFHVEECKLAKNPGSKQMILRYNLQFSQIFLYQTDIIFSFEIQC